MIRTLAVNLHALPSATQSVQAMKMQTSKLAWHVPALDTTSLPIIGQPGTVGERADASRNRRNILQAARRLLRSQSIKDICMETLAHEAGVGKGTLYRRFRDRRSLCYALLDEEMRALQNASIRFFGLPPTASPQQRLRAFVTNLVGYHLTNVELLAEASCYNGVTSLFEHPVRVWQRDELARLLDGIRRPTAHELNNTSIAELALSVFDPNMLLWQLEKGVPPATLETGLVAFVMSSLMGPR